MKSESTPEPSSFRDPSGFIFRRENVLYRQINDSYREEYDHFLSSGLYTELTNDGLLILHEEIAERLPQPGYKLIRPEPLSFISYPYEWCFSQLQDAALATLRLQRLALDFDMTLKDASAYNIQFRRGKPVLIDTLSFERYQEGHPWIAYRQFCQHFLAPLALMSYLDLHLGTLSERYLDGIPLELAVSLLPHRTSFSLGLATHLHLHARSQRHHATSPSKSTTYHLPKGQLLGLISNLEATVRSLRFPKQATTWGAYYQHTNYSSEAAAHKEKTVASWISSCKPSRVWDAGANDATFARLASHTGIPTVATDIDPNAVEQAYHTARGQGDELLPLILDLTNPTPAIGWENKERMSFIQRGPFDLTLALALVHHLAIANNLPLPEITQFFADLTNWLIIEFVPKEDSNTGRLLAAREDIFPDYTAEGFEQAFSKKFQIQEKVAVKESHRTLYLLRRRNS